MDYNTERLEQEIRSAYSTVRTSIKNRRDHPSFGYTKANIREATHRLFGLVEAWAYITGTWHYPARMHDSAIVEVAKEKFNLSIRDLRMEWM